MSTALTEAPRARTRTNNPAGITGVAHNGRNGKGAELSIHLLSPLFAGWAELEEPDEATPCWHESDGTPHTLRDLAAGQPPDKVDEIYQRHYAAVRRLVAAAGAAALRGEHREARRLASASSMLCGEVVGLWPISARTVRR